MSRTVRLTEVSAAQLRGLPPRAKQAVRHAMRSVAVDATGKSGRLNLRELRAPAALPRVFRCRVGVWRFAFYPDARHIHVVRVFHRREGYGWLDPEA